ncbi:MAG: alpha/beta hydrolase [Deltaproteobacteria bacterium]|nr:alpha/beta hydrolase [bacterium]MCB9475973.1 alpha/beta hydrolase [Deltaproteobacteria bacterium]MCB9487109.1 alpha/beta hydrolase [Deltaproteobacteria bacterium]
MKIVAFRTGIPYRLRNPRGGDRAIVFVHGAAGNKLAWLRCTRYLAALLPDHPIYYLDLPGHGESTKPPELSIDGYAEVLLEFLEELRLSPAVLVGHSMGGAVALTAALREPMAVEKIAVMGSGYRITLATGLIELLEDDYPKAIGMIRDFGFGDNPSPQEVATTMESLMSCDPETAITDFKALAEYDVKGEIGRLRPPLAVFYGSSDKLTSPERNRALADAVPDAEHHAFEGAGHMLMLERPEELASQLARFIVPDFDDSA